MRLKILDLCAADEVALLMVVPTDKVEALSEHLIGSKDDWHGREAR